MEIRIMRLQAISNAILILGFITIHLNPTLGRPDAVYPSLF